MITALIVAVTIPLLTVGGLLFFANAIFAWHDRRQIEMHAEIIARLEIERDYARHEAKVYRGLLMPAVKRAEAESDDAVPAATPRSAAQGSSTASTHPAPLRRGRQVPYRSWFNQARRLTNTKQQRVDALGDAIENARKVAAHKSVEEKNNGESW